MKLSEFVKRYCFHDSTLGYLKCIPQKKELWMVVEDYGYSNDLEPLEDTRILEIVFHDCRNVKDIPVVIADGMDDIYSCTREGDKLTFLIVGGFGSGELAFSFEASGASVKDITWGTT